MSLMNYGFTKSKHTETNDDDDELEVIFDKRQEDTMSPSRKNIKKLNPKSASKYPAKSDEIKTEAKLNTSKMSNMTMFSKKSPKSNAKPPTPKKSPSNTTPNKSPSNTTPNKSPSNTTPNKSKSHKDNINRSVQENINEMDCESSPNSKRASMDNSLPYQRIKMIMKSCPDVDIVQQESLHVVTKATEMFIQHLARESFKLSKRMLDYESLSNLVCNEDKLEFLKETIPKKITWAECQKLMAANKQENKDLV